MLTFKYIHGLAPYYLPNAAITTFKYIHGQNTRISENMDLYVTRYTKIFVNVFLYKGSMFLSNLPDILMHLKQI